VKKIGLVGGMSWESTDTYYQLINRGIRDRLGDLNSAEMLMYSLNFADVEEHQRNGNFLVAANKILHAAGELERAGAEGIFICSVTGHEGADYIQSKISIPLIHIADCINPYIEDYGRVGLIATVYTMERGYFKSRLIPEVIVPEEEDRRYISSVIYNEISQGIILESSAERYRQIIKKLIVNGAEAIIYGCTEIGLLVNHADACVPVYDTTIIHCQAAIDFTLGTS
jgi:aspartate racemase